MLLMLSIANTVSIITIHTKLQDETKDSDIKEKTSITYICQLETMQ
jgi:hypothetical protein